MLECAGNIWEYLDTSIVAITTNGQVSKKGRAVMGRGVASQAACRFPDIPGILGQLLTTSGNHVHYLGNNIVSFPVEQSPFQLPDLKLIGRSARELRDLADGRGWQKVVVPRPGCGGGGLLWRDVRPLLMDVFDDRFLVISVPPSAGGD